MRQSAPGKLILMGEHAAVYGHPALVAAVDLRLTAEITPRRRPGVSIELPDIDHRTELGWSELMAYERRVAERWAGFADDPERVPFAEVRGTDPAHLVKLALAVAQRELGPEAPPDLRLRITSQIPVGSGLGSSAALGVAVLSGYLRFCAETVSKSRLDRLALEVERRQHGTPSGVDSATVARGGVLWTVRRESGGLKLERVAVPSRLLASFEIYSSGTPHESTGAVVAGVREGWRRDRHRFESIFERLGAESRELRRQLELGSSEGAAASLRRAEACLEELGVVPAAVAEVVRRVEATGGAAKISGAGALTGSRAGSLLVLFPGPRPEDRHHRLVPFPALPVKLGGAGVRAEETGARGSGHVS